jgi:small GTP-binding protein
MASLYYKDATAAILVYDVTNEKSFESISYWVEELKNKATRDNMVMCLVGNKCDIEQNQKKISTNTAKSNYSFFIFSLFRRI